MHKTNIQKIKIPKIIAIANQKGGVGKTNVTFNLSGALVESGQKLLLIDLDQQGNLSSAFINKIYDPGENRGLKQRDGSSFGNALVNNRITSHFLK